MSLGVVRTGCLRLATPVRRSSHPTLPIVSSWRSYTVPTSPAQYAGPRTSRSFRRTRKEVELQGGKTLRRQDIPGESSLSDQLAVPEPYRATSSHRRAVIEIDSGLHRPVQIQRDPKGVLKETEGAMRLLSNSALVIVRQLEMMNVFLGFEQANRYVIMNVNGEHVGYLAEEDQGIMSTITRQVLRTHRPFKSVVMDVHGNPLFYIRRPFAFINSKIHVHAEESRLEDSKVIVGEAQQEWHPWRRRYNIFKNRDNTYKQFARIDSGMLAWTFMLQNGQGNIIASIDKNFAGIARELFTDTGQYVVRFDAVQEELGLPITAPSVPDARSVNQESPKEATDLTLDERAMTLATAVTIDIDYFSRHSGSGLGFPMFFWGGGGGGDLQAGETSRAGESEGDLSQDSGWSDGSMSDDVFEDPF